jgi:hypothetical protein
MANRLFDPIAFMNETLPENATRRDPRPAGETIGQVVALDWKSGEVKKLGSPNYGKPWYRLDAKIEVTDPEYLAQRENGTGDKELFTYGIMYDGDETGRPKVGPNVNISLGRFRDACSANGKPFSACVGAMLRIQVIQKPHPTEADVVLDEVSNVTRA